MNDDTNIRIAVGADTAALISFNQAMAIETEGKQLEAQLLSEGVAAVFGDDKKGFYVVAESSGDIIGGLMVTYEWSDWRNRMVWWIQSVYVSPDARRDGVFRALYDTAHREARAANAGGLRLYVDTTNTKAQAVYTALGMNGDHYRVFEAMF